MIIGVLVSNESLVGVVLFVINRIIAITISTVSFGISRSLLGRNCKDYREEAGLNNHLMGIWSYLIEFTHHDSDLDHPESLTDQSSLMKFRPRYGFLYPMTIINTKDERKLFPMLFIDILHL